MRALCDINLIKFTYNMRIQIANAITTTTTTVIYTTVINNGDNDDDDE